MCAASALVAGHSGSMRRTAWAPACSPSSLSRPFASLFDVPVALVAGLGVGAVVWASVLLVLARRAGWRRPVALVAVANLLAAVCFAALAALAPGVAAQVLLAALAAEVLAFAGAQALALRGPS